ncbi:MAG: lipopolysaccharide biosynthesis protein [Hydrogenophaga sp.]|uniref:lipopolysaccharide biosynthesis protein n=1 Tax=Hydrogenophaga sp. TaxID=1904254 RepID=UPI003D0C4055
MKPSFNAKSTLIMGALWTVGSRWAIKGIGFLNTVIMARLLVPEDYGVVAIAMLIVSFIQALVDFGAANALLRKDTVGRDEVDSAWTLRVLQSIAVGALLLTIAPLAADGFTEPRVQEVLFALALCVMLHGFSNIGMTLAEKAFNFSLDFKLNVISKTLSVLATVSAGFWLGDYRALVIGIGTGYISGLVLSYWLHPYRPRWNTSKIAEIWAVTKWLMLAGLGTFLLRKSDEVLAARYGTTAEYGTYNVGADLGSLPIGELGPAMMRAFLPVLTSMQDDVRRTNDVVVKTLAAVNAITLPIGMGVAALAVPITGLLLGPKWSDAAPFVAVFGMVGCVQFLMNPLAALLFMRGHTRVQNRVVWIEFGCFALLAFVLVPQMHLIGLAWARLFASMLNALITVITAKVCCGIRPMGVLGALWRPLSGACAMYALVVQLGQHGPDGIAGVLTGVCLGALFYAAWLASTWYFAGKPDGLESIALGFLKQRRAVKVDRVEAQSSMSAL